MIGLNFAERGVRATPAPTVVKRAFWVRRPSLVLVVGSAELALDLADLAATHRRTIVGRVARLDGSSAALPAHDEVAVDVELLGDPTVNGDRLASGVPVWLCRRTAAGAVQLTDGAAPFSHPFPPLGRAVKRAVDVTLAMVLLVVTLPLQLLAAIAIRLETPGPAVFRQTRLGENGRAFTLHKLRTMHADNDPTEHEAFLCDLIDGRSDNNGRATVGVAKLREDPRVTKVGAVLRKWSIDELPQLWDVLRGHMSLVGPRPPLPREVAHYDASAWRRLRVKGGMTGLWQVNGRSQLGFREMTELDAQYWQEWSLRRDAVILLRTPAVALLERDTA